MLIIILCVATYGDIESVAEASSTRIMISILEQIVQLAGRIHEQKKNADRKKSCKKANRDEELNISDYGCFE